MYLLRFSVLFLVLLHSNKLFAATDCSDKTSAEYGHKTNGVTFVDYGYADPLPDFLNTKVNQTYLSPTYWEGKQHLGVDFMKEAGTNVYSVCSGKVIENRDYSTKLAEYSRFSDREQRAYNDSRVVIKCDRDGAAYVYGHVKDALRLNTQVEEGAVIAQVTEAYKPYTTERDYANDHLHFGINSTGNIFYDKIWGWGIANLTSEELGDQATEKGWVDPYEYLCESSSEAKQEDVEAPSEKEQEDVKVPSKAVLPLGRFVKIPGGTFRMDCGCSKNGRQDFNVTVKTFEIGQIEVTQGLWKSVMHYNPSKFYSCGDGCPVENVSWYDVQTFIEKLNKIQDTCHYRLPTEAEWEYACRSGGSEQEYCGGGPGAAPLIAWYQKNSGDQTHQSGQKQPNAIGLYDMSGNVLEWTCSNPGNYMTMNHIKCTYNSDNKIIRGGSFRDPAHSLRFSTRQVSAPNKAYANLGFRLARTCRANR
ncbi:MAG: SUMF1/EgtB/PvdO family nonheme iron enzyme [Magnetococcales bacterium]|nr:SUMF1/EgtB/PvdO family nonheme iron enzyme [Magnetococcales bacterium]